MSVIYDSFVAFDCHQIQFYPDLSRRCNHQYLEQPCELNKTTEKVIHHNNRRKSISSLCCYLFSVVFSRSAYVWLLWTMWVSNLGPFGQPHPASLGQGGFNWGIETREREKEREGEGRASYEFTVVRTSVMFSEIKKRIRTLIQL